MIKYLHGLKNNSHFISLLKILCQKSISTRENSLECLKYLHNFGYEWNSNTCQQAAKCGRLEILEYLHENGCEWTSSTTQTAFEFGNYECLKYALDNCCKWDFTNKYIENNDKFKCLEIAFEFIKTKCS